MLRSNLAWLAAILVPLAGCSSPSADPSSSGGSTASPSSGGALTSGGTSPSLGGAASNGGSAGSTGIPGGAGALTSGGAFGSGGATQGGGTQGGNTNGGVSSGGATQGGGTQGGSINGGTTGAGGKAGSGGTQSQGGASSGGGSAKGGSTSSSGGTSGGNASGGSASGGVAGGTGGGSCGVPVPGSKGTNPLFTDQYTADPAPFVHDCTFYIATGHDEGNTGFVLREWFLLSSTDMVHWTKKVAMKLGDFAWADANAWAGQIVTKNNKFYWYVPVNERGGGMTIAVAVADSMAGPWKDALGKPLINDAFEMSNMNFSEPGQTPFTSDPTVFVDDDGQAYLHYGGFWRLVVAKLNPDMISISGTMKEVTPNNFFEAPYLFKRNNKYYEVYAAGQNPATINYATSNSPQGPWTAGGVIIDKLPNVSGQDAATSHAGVAQFGDQWYIVYHLSNGPNNGGTYRREVAVDKLNFNTDGSIQKIALTSGLTF